MTFYKIFNLLIFTSCTAVFAEPVGNLGFTEGEVYLNGNRVEKTAPVEEGAMIETKEGKTTLMLGKGSVFYIGPNSRMVVDAYGVKQKSKTAPAEETGELELKFGRTRALIRNQAGKKKNIKIKARAATMGVRGTEIFISAPEAPTEPVQFFTLEGSADVQAAPQGPVVAVGQNEGVETSGSGGEKQAAQGSGGSDDGSNAGAPAPKKSSMSVSAVKAEIKSSGMQTPAVAPQGPGFGGGPGGNLSDTFGTQGLPQLIFDPLQDTYNPLTITPKYCRGSDGVCL